MEATVTTTRSGAASVFRVRSVSTLVGVGREELPATVAYSLRQNTQRHVRAFAFSRPRAQPPMPGCVLLTWSNR